MDNDVDKSAAADDLPLSPSLSIALRRKKDGLSKNREAIPFRNSAWQKTVSRLVELHSREGPLPYFNATSIEGPAGVALAYSRSRLGFATVSTCPWYPANQACVR